jgi:hypothetical protein
MPRDGDDVSDREEILQRALSYPYEIPDRSFLQLGKRTVDLPSDPDLAGRIPVLAFGSNSAPEVLIRKFKLSGSGDSVPVVRAELRDFDIVYSAHISAYGSIPAAIQASPGTVVSTYVTYLTPEQLTTMSQTELNYFLAGLEPISCRLETGEELTTVASYLSRHGCLAVDFGEVALADVAATDRRFPKWGEREAIEHVRRQLSPEQSLEEFIVENVADPRVAKERTEILRQNARPFAGPARDLPEY